MMEPKKPQSWLKAIMHALKFPPSDGYCLGVDTMAMLAILHESRDGKNRLIEVENFNQRIKRLRSHTPDQILQLIEDAQNKYNCCYKVADFLLETMTEEQWAECEERFDLPAEISALEKKILLHPIFLTLAISFYMTGEEKIDFEILRFLTAVNLIQMPEKYPVLFNPKQKLKGQSLKLTLPLVLSTLLEAQGGITNLGNYSVVYTPAELEIAFSKFEFYFAPIGTPVALILNTRYHAISIAYDPIEAIWFYADLTFMSEEDQICRLSREDLVEVLFLSLTQNDICILGHQVYIGKAYQLIGLDALRSWRLDEKILSLFEATPEKIKARDSNGSSWLDMSIYMGEQARVERLLRRESFFKRYRKEIIIYSTLFIIMAGLTALAAGTGNPILGVALGFEVLLVISISYYQSLRKYNLIISKAKATNQELQPVGESQNASISQITKSPFIPQVKHHQFFSKVLQPPQNISTIEPLDCPVRICIAK